MNTESANRFIAALVKSLQTLCHGYVDFDDGIEIIGHLYLNIDSGSTFDYVLKEKVCKNAENSTVFVSKSFHAEGKPENTLIQNDKDIIPSQEEGQTANIGDNGMSPSGTTRIQSAITNISNVLSGNSDHHSSQSPLPLNTGRRKRDHNGSYNNQSLSYKYTTLQSSSSSAMPYFNNSTKQHSSNRDGSKHFGASQSQGEFFGGDSNQSSGMGGDDEEDLHLDVTFVKEEYQDRHRGHISRTHQDPSSNQNTLMSENSANSGAYSMGFHSGTQNQQFSGSGNGGDMSSNINPPFQDPSQVDTGQHHLPAPNPRNDATAGPPPRMPDGVKPLCGYVHPDDAKKWMMYELIPNSGVYIHQENYNVVLSKTRQDRPDGKAMARYLMSCFWRQSELVGASIAEPPKPHQKSLDRGIIYAILGFCQHHSRELPTDIRRTIQQKIGYAKFYFVKKTHDPDLPKTMAAIAAEASPRRMSIEMARRNSSGIPIEAPPVPRQQPSHGKRGRRASEVIMSRSHRTPDGIHDSISHSGGSPDIPRPSSTASIDFPVDPRAAIEEIQGKFQSYMNEALAVAESRAPFTLSNDVPNSTSNPSRSSSSEMIYSRVPPPLPRLPSPGDHLSSRMISEMTNRLSHPSDLSSRRMDLSTRAISSEMVARMAAENVDEGDGSNTDSRAHSDVGGGGGPASSTVSLASRTSSSAGTVPAGMSRGFLDMLNSMYPNNN